MVTIHFSNGYTVEANLNADTFVTDVKPDFPKDLKTVILTGEREETLKNVQIIECFSPDDSYCFGLREIPQDELSSDRMKAQALYTALITDTLLED